MLVDSGECQYWHKSFFWVYWWYNLFWINFPTNKFIYIYIIRIFLVNLLHFVVYFVATFIQGSADQKNLRPSGSQRAQWWTNGMSKKGHKKFHARIYQSHFACTLPATSFPFLFFFYFFFFLLVTSFLLILLLMAQWF